MSTNLRPLIVAQTNTIALLKQVMINFKKLAESNITLSEAKGRLSDPNELWNKV